jgi:hypothetical protein
VRVFLKIRFIGSTDELLAAGLVARFVGGYLRRQIAWLICYEPKHTQLASHLLRIFSV